MANLRIKGDVSGYVDLVSPDVAGSTTIALDKIVTLDANGNLGVGTSGTPKKLTVASSTQYDGLLVTNGSNYIAELVGFSATNDAGGLKLRNNGTATVEVQSSGTTFFNGGNVGIGTSSPSSPLHVETTSQRVGTFISTGSDPQIYLGDAASSDNAIILGYDRADNRGYLTVAGDGDNVFTVTNGGDIGIGTSGPASKLEVYKSGATRAYIGNTNNGHVFMSQSDVGYDGFQVYQQHGTNQSRNSFSIQDNRTGTKSPAFGVRGDGTVFVGQGAGTNNAQTTLTVGGTGHTFGNVVYYTGLGAGSNYVDASNPQYKIRMQINRNAMYYKGVTVELYADSGADWGGHGYVNYYGKFIVVFRDTTAHTVYAIENHGRNYLQGASTYLYDATSGFYDTNYYYVDFRFTSNQAADGGTGFRPKFSAIGYQNDNIIHAIGVIN